MSRLLRIQRLHQDDPTHQVAKAHRETARIHFHAPDRPGINSAENVLIIAYVKRIK